MRADVDDMFIEEYIMDRSKFKGIMDLQLDSLKDGEEDEDGSYRGKDYKVELACLSKKY